jgi:hypothetical protein
MKRNLESEFPNPSKGGPIPILARPARRLTQNGIPQKRGQKLSSKMMGKSTSKIAFATRGTRSHFRKAGISLNGIWIPNFPKRSEAAQNRRKPNETGNFRGNGRPKKNHENRAQKWQSKSPLVWKQHLASSALLRNAE